MTTLDGLGFPEALRWRDGALWFSDMFRSRVMRWAPGSPAEIVLDAAGGGPTMPGGIGWLPDDDQGRGDLIVVDCERRRVLRVHDATITVHADLGGLMTHFANDMHVDPDGTAWVGGYGFDPDDDAPAPSPLVRVAADGTISATESRFIFPNGCERHPDGSLLVAETFADRVSALSPSGDVIVRGILPSGSGPDGLSIAPNGDVYIALAFAGALARLARPEIGQDAEPSVRRVAERLEDDSASSPLGVYDCAVHPDGRRIAVALASLDEAVAARSDTGRIVILDLP